MGPDEPQAREEPASQLLSMKWKELYEWLGMEISMRTSSAADLSTPQELSMKYATLAEAFMEARMRMRDLDESLEFEDGVDNAL